MTYSYVYVHQFDGQNLLFTCRGWRWLTGEERGGWKRWRRRRRGVSNEGVMTARRERGRKGRRKRLKVVHVATRLNREVGDK